MYCQKENQEYEKVPKGCIGAIVGIIAIAIIIYLISSISDWNEDRKFQKYCETRCSSMADCKDPSRFYTKQCYREYDKLNQ
jgi:hypothetical protein